MPACKDVQEATYWDVARMSKLPGATITTTVDPKQWTTTMKNKVKKSLIGGYVLGGYSSVSAALAKAMARKFDVPIIENGQCYVRMEASYGEATRDKLVELVKADFMAWRMTNEENKRYVDYIESNYKQMLRNLENLVPFHYGFQDNQFANAAKAALAESRTPEVMERVYEACSLIDQGIPFEFTT